MSNMTNCAVCGITAGQKCSACRNVVYCSKEHQKAHWKKEHKALCKCFEVVSNDQLGRHMRATRDIQQGEVILREKPLMIGPKTASEPLCLGCHRRLPAPDAPPRRSFYKCHKCGWPLCGRSCETSTAHIDECRLMTKKKYYGQIEYNPNSEKPESAYCVITPLRCMMLRDRDEDLYKRFIALESHLEERLKTPLYTVLQGNLVPFFQTVLGLTDWSESEIMRIAAILDTNCFELRHRNEKLKLRGVYLTAAMISHDCVPNVRHTFDDDMEIVFIAKWKILKGEIISTTYTQSLNSTLQRRAHLEQTKCFQCTCKRCADPEELGTFAGSILCSHCKVGKIVSTDPLDDAAVWRCQLCPHRLPARQINLGNAAIQKELDLLDRNSPRALELFLQRYNEVLHETNTHVLQVKYALTQLYGGLPGNPVHTLNNAALKRKIDLCHELLEVAERIDGGYSMWRAHLLIALHAAVVAQARREFVNELITRDAALNVLRQAVLTLQEAVEIVKFEPTMKNELGGLTEALSTQLEL